MSSERWVLEVGREEDTQLTEALGTGLTESARATGNTFVRRELWVAARDDSRKLLGGLTGQFQFAWLYVARLWVGADHRGLGIGRALMHEAERQAVEEKCLGVHLQTYGFQARGFYEQLGYRVFAEIEDDAPDRTRYFLRRNLRTSA